MRDQLQNDPTCLVTAQANYVRNADKRVDKFEGEHVTSRLSVQWMDMFVMYVFEQFIRDFFCYF